MFDIARMEEQILGMLICNEEMNETEQFSMWALMKTEIVMKLLNK